MWHESNLFNALPHTQRTAHKHQAHTKINGDWQYDAKNRVIQRGTGSNATTYQYDDNGNLTQKTENGKVTRYVYDTSNRLTEVWDISAGSSASAAKLVARYGYDPMSRRIWKEQFRDQDAQLLIQALPTTYLYADEAP